MRLAPAGRGCRATPGRVSLLAAVVVALLGLLGVIDGDVAVLGSPEARAESEVAVIGSPEAKPGAVGASHTARPPVGDRQDQSRRPELARPGMRRASVPGQPWIIAHRGGTELAPQNTMAAFDHAIKSDLEVIETDVRHTADHVAVLLHDPALPSTCSPFTGSDVRALTYRQLSTVRCAGHPIPRLTELVERLMRPDAQSVMLLPEIKDIDPLGVRDAVAPLGWSRVMIQSFGLPTLRTIELASPQVVTCAVISVPAELTAALAATSDCVMPEWHAVDASLVTRVHQAGGFVFPYTVNSSSALRQLADKQVDGLVTDRPGLAVHTLRRPHQAPK